MPKLHRVALFLAASFVGPGTGLAHAEDLSLGTLRARGEVEITSPSGKVSLPASSYPYIAGQRVATGGGEAAGAELVFDQGTLSLGRESAASVHLEAGVYRVELDRGELRFRFADARMLEIWGPAFSLRPLLESKQRGTAAGLVAVAADGSITVESAEGTLEVRRQQDAAPAAVVSAGQGLHLAPGTGGLTPVGSALAPVGAEGSSFLYSLGNAAPYALGATAAAGAGYAIGDATADDDDDDDDDVVADSDDDDGPDASPDN